VAETFGLDEDEVPLDASLAGHPHSIHIAPSKSHFTNINILGGDFCYMKRLRAWGHDKGPTVTYFIGRDKWGLPSKL